MIKLEVKNDQLVSASMPNMVIEWFTEKLSTEKTPKLDRKRILAKEKNTLLSSPNRTTVWKLMTSYNHLCRRESVLPSWWA